MAYRIEYALTGKVLKERKQNRNRWITVACVFILTTGILHVTDVADAVRDFLIPGDTEVTAAAWNQMMEVLRDGGSFGQAALTFCEQVLEGAGFEG